MFRNFIGPDVDDLIFGDEEPAVSER